MENYSNETPAEKLAREKSEQEARPNETAEQRTARLNETPEQRKARELRERDSQR